MIHTGQAIRTVRRRKKLTQVQLGELLGVDQQRVSVIERTQYNSVKTMVKVAKVTGTTLAIKFNSPRRII